MKALVLAAGRGTRMNHITDDKPKPLIKINNRPFLEYVLGSISEAGISEVGIVVGYKKEKIIEYLESSPLEISFIEQKEQLGTGHAVKIAKSWAGVKDFIVLMGDNLYSSVDIARIANDDGFCYVSGYEHDKPEMFGVLMTDGGMLDRIMEKPAKAQSNLVNTGMYKFTPEIFTALDSIKRSGRGEFEVTDAINLLCRKRLVKFIRLNDYWLNLGSPGDIPIISRFLKEKMRGAGRA